MFSGIKKILHKHTNRSGRKRHNRQFVYSYHFSRLYDALHAKSHVKRKWFRSLCYVFEKEFSRHAAIDDHLSDSSGFSDTVSLLETDSDS